MPAPLFVPQPVIGVGMMPGQPPMPMGQPMPMGGQPMPMGQQMPAQVVPAAPGMWSDAPAAADPAPTKYAAERLLEGTRIGDFMAERGWRFYGWNQMSYTYGTASQSNAPMIIVDRAHEFLFNQNYIVFEKTIDTSKKEFQLGFRSDTLAFASDARFTIPRGLNEYQLRHNYLYPYDPVQSYAEAYLPNLGGEGTSVKIGRFYNPAGYESVMATATPFLTRSYGFTYTAFTYTGVLATTYLSDAVAVSYGATFGPDAFVDPASRFTFVGGVKFGAKDGTSSLAINAQVTNPKYNAKEAFANYNTYNVVFTQKLGEKWAFAFDASGSHMTEFPGTDGAAWWYGAASYLSYEFNKCVTGLARAEVWNDDKGVRTGTAGTYTDVTVGVQWKLADAVILTPEFRYDHNLNRPFEGGRQDLFTGALSLIVRW